MRVGKISESMLNRSVFKLFRHRRKDVYKKPSVGQDCNFVAVGDERVCFSTNPVTLPLDKLGKKAIYYVANNIVCQGAELVGVLVNVLMPACSDEKDIKLIMNDLETVCGELNIEVMGGHTEMLENVTETMLVMTGVGRLKQDDMLDTKSIEVGYDIVMTKWVGMEGASVIAENKREELKSKYKDELIDDAKEMSDMISIIKDATIAKANGALYMHDVTSSGVYGGLWELSCGIKHGIEVDLQRIPIRQEIVEICEFYDLNPYLLEARGVLLFVVKDGKKVVDELLKEGIDADIIGKVCDHNNKIVRNDDEMRYLDPPSSKNICCL